MRNPPPIYERIAAEDGKAPLPWVMFFNQMMNGDSGTSWTPTFKDLTEVGTPTITGRYYRLSKYLTLFFVTIIPGTSTSAVAGTTYIDNFPMVFSGDGFVFAVTGGLGSNSGHIVKASNRIYVPAWTAVTVQLTLIGLAEAG